MLVLLSDFVVSVLATLVSAGILAFLGYIFRQKIRRAFKGEVLVPSSFALDFSLAIEGPSWNKGVETAHLVVGNAGEVEVSNLQLFVCKFSSRGLCITPIKQKGLFRSISTGEGERIQFDVPSSWLDFNFGREEARIFVQGIDSRGTCYRKTFYLLPGKRVSPQLITRSRKPLPSRRIVAHRAADIASIGKRYTLDLSCG